MPQFPTYTVIANMESTIGAKGSVLCPCGSDSLPTCLVEVSTGCQLEQLAEINAMIDPKCQTIGLFHKEWRKSYLN